MLLITAKVTRTVAFNSNAHYMLIRTNLNDNKPETTKKCNIH